ncbi:MAG: aminoglycoside phosphotransferase [Rhodospirillaceae bacterium]|nr:MAG: aminoglycoside phosphotransferase [Rhodospirillaceae bacterium]
MTTQPETRAAAMRRFLAAHGWERAERRPLAGDASFRRYERLSAAGGARAVLMDAPPPHEDVRPFVRLARHLDRLGFSVPTVLAMEEADGFLLLEDLGDETYTRLLAAGSDEKTLYQRAVDVLIALHRCPPARAIPPETPLYDRDRLLAEAGFLPEWHLPAVSGLPMPVSAAARAAYDDAWRNALKTASELSVPNTLVLRDFHVDNLMVLEDRPGVRACGLLDFQDAVVAPVTYDLMSLLEDARRDMAPSLVTALTRHYLDAFPDLDREAFAASWAVLAAQRHTRVVGVFTRLCVRDGKSAYLHHIPRVWGLLERACRHPALAAVAAWFDHHVPSVWRCAPAFPRPGTRP